MTSLTLDWKTFKFYLQKQVKKIISALNSGAIMLVPVFVKGKFWFCYVCFLLMCGTKSVCHKFA